MVSCASTKKKENKVNLISFQKKGGWINTNTHIATHLLIPASSLVGDEIHTTVAKAKYVLK